MANITVASAFNPEDAAIKVSASPPLPLTSSPQLVENTLKEFYEYLQCLKEKLQHCQHLERQRSRPCLTGISTATSSASAASDVIRVTLSADKTKGDGDVVLDYWNRKKMSSHDDTGDTADAALLTAADEWTFDRDTKNYLVHLGRFKDKILEQIDRFPLHSKAGREILEAIQSAASRGRAQHLSQPGDVLRHVRQLALYVSRLLQEIQLVDLDLLIDYMARNQHAGDVMAGKDVLLLCGAARAGKTTTLHFLAGSTLEEVEVDGFFHIQATAVKDPALANYATSVYNNSHGRSNIAVPSSTIVTGREPVTTHLQTAEVNMGEHTIVICDTPGLAPNDEGLSSQSVEWDIANGLGMIRAIHRARSVKPVWVINRDEVSFRERFTNAALDGETVASMQRLMLKSPDPCDMGPFNYVFTKYEAKHRDVLCRQFAVMKKTCTFRNHTSKVATELRHPISYEEINQKMNKLGNHLGSSSRDDHTYDAGASGPGTATTSSTSRESHSPNYKAHRWMRKVLDDIVKKITPRAQIVLPLQDDPQTFLQQLWDDCRTVNDPKRFFVPFVSYPALKKLQLQLRITLSDLRTSLVEDDQTTAVYRLQQLQRLAQVLPEATDCAKLGVEAVKKHMTGLRSRVMAAIERKDYSMAIHRAQQLVTLSEVLPEAKTYGTITHDAVVLLRDLISALQATDYRACHDCMAKLSELAKEFPEANKCAQFALQASILHVSEFRETVMKLVDNLLEVHAGTFSKEGTYKFTTMLEQLQLELTHVVASEPLLLLCVKEDSIGLSLKEERAIKELAKCTGEAFCIDQVQRVTDRLQRDIPNFQSSTFNPDDLLKRREAVLTGLERLKILSVQLRQSPAGARANSMYHQAFKSFHDLVSSLLSEAESMYKSTWTDLDLFGRKVWLVAVLLQGPLKGKPHTERREHIKIEDLERRVLKLMIRLEIEVKRSMDKLKNFKFPECSTNKAFLKYLPIPDFGIAELKGPRFLLIAVAKNARIRKLLPSNLDVLAVNVCIAMFDHALVAFWRKMVIRLEQDYAVVVAMQKTKKDVEEIHQVAKQLLADIEKVEEEFLGVCGWSDDITNESEADLKRFIAVRDCVQMGVKKMDEMSTSKSRRRNLFSCGNLDSVDDITSSNLCASTANIPNLSKADPRTNAAPNKDSSWNSMHLCRPKAAPE
jgi:hypothetical protein